MGSPRWRWSRVVALTSYYQQKQIQGRNPNAEIPPQQQMLMKLMPAMFVIFAFIEPTALVVYFIVSNVYRVGMQAYITRTSTTATIRSVPRPAGPGETKKLSDEHGGPQLLPASEEAGRDRHDGPGGQGSRAVEARHQRCRGEQRKDGHQQRCRPDAAATPQRWQQPIQEEEEAALMEWVETTGKTIDEAKDAPSTSWGGRAGRGIRGARGAPGRSVRAHPRRGRVRARVKPTQPARRWSAGIARAVLGSRRTASARVQGPRTAPPRARPRTRTPRPWGAPSAAEADDITDAEPTPAAVGATATGGGNGAERAGNRRGVEVQGGARTGTPIGTTTTGART